ncbi:DUF6279 family lipoprotein [Aestuariibacter sp. A3R04]|uniref:DUF6279 family lipoprotein n=1 Tax=Aestuariibacter sp. A3R04 TaxID=2841571 RepID=UPI001C08D312|nr:DUF6279 family lipoprotein [Aestuariibacter sp. A3R04]MBU3022944.1 hypothetical protein [Aestuariibacter sp. A3R04]
MKYAIAVIIIMFISGCSNKLAYNNIDWLVYWYMDDYVELNEKQEAVFDAKLRRWIDWHRSKELPRYTAHLRALRNDLRSESLSVKTLLKHYDQASEHWQRLRNEITPQLAVIAADLSDEQVIHLFAALESDNKEKREVLAKRVGLTDEEKMEARVEDLIENMEERIGRLTAEQVAIVNRYAPRFTSSSQLWLDYRTDLQQRARRLFISRKTDPQFISKLTGLLLDPEQYRSDTLIDVWHHNRETHAMMAAEIAATLTATQRNKADKMLTRLIDDFAALQQDNK